MVKEFKADWNAGDEFCRFIIEMEREASKGRNRISDAVYNQDGRLVGKFLDDWLESLQSIYDKTNGYMDEKTIETLNEIEKEIKDVTKGDYFSNTGLGSKELNTALNLIRKFNRSISYFLARAGIYMKTDIKRTYKDAQEELNKRNEGL